jgi:hypothetical protein
MPVPRCDDGIYKSPGAELAQHGRLTVPAARGFLPQAERVFAAYPPLYPVMVGVWYMVLGVSLPASLAYNFTLHLLGVIGVMAVADRLVKATLLPATTSSGVIRASTILVVAVGLIHLVNLSHFDRPEETALLWIWPEVLVVHGLATRLGWWRSLASGLLLGLAGLTAPWVGVLGALIITLRAMFTALQSQRPGRLSLGATMIVHLAIVGAVAAIMVGTWYAVMEYICPGAVRQQMTATLGYLKGTQITVDAWQKLQAFRGTLLDNRLQLPAAAVALAFFAVEVAQAGWRRVAPLGLALYLTAVIGIAVVALVRPAAYTYFGATLIVLLPCLGTAMVRDLCCESVASPAELLAGRAVASGSASRKWLAIVTLFLCTAVASAETGGLAVAGQWLPDNQRPDRVFTQLWRAIPPGQSVAVTSTHWLAFQGRNPWREILMAPADSREIRQCQWLVLPSRVGQPDFIDRFELVGATSPARPASEAYGYSLWRRRDAGDELNRKKVQD